MRWLQTFLATLVALAATTALADDIRFAPEVTVQAAVTLVADEDGILQIDRSKPILIGGVATTPTDPKDPTDPIPVPSDPLAVRVSTLLASAPTGTAAERKATSALYKTTGSLPLTEAAQIRQATTILFNVLGMPEAWKKWKVDVDKFAGGLSVEDIRRAWQLIAEGLAR